MKERVCLTTFVYGDKYQDYIPLLMYSIGKAYPGYFTMIFLHGKIRNDIQEQLEIVKEFYTNFEIVEKKFSDCPQMNPLNSKALRWVLWDDKFKEFDYLYVVDIDILYIPEAIPLHEQHIRHMNYIGSDCISNIIRYGKTRKNLINTLRAYKNGGILGSINYLSIKGEYKISGLHFVKIDTYFSYINEQVRDDMKNLIYQNNIRKKSKILNNEAFLYKIMQESGIDMSVFAEQSNPPTAQLDPNLPERGEFRPHHGIHLGIFRSQLKHLMNNPILISDTYLFYVDYYKKNIINDPVFWRIMHISNNEIKSYLSKYCEFYNIDNSNES